MAYSFDELLRQNQAQAGTRPPNLTVDPNTGAPLVNPRPEGLGIRRNLGGVIKNALQGASSSGGVGTSIASSVLNAPEIAQGRDEAIANLRSQAGFPITTPPPGPAAPPEVQGMRRNTQVPQYAPPATVQENPEAPSFAPPRPKIDLSNSAATTGITNRIDLGNGNYITRGADQTDESVARSIAAANRTYPDVGGLRRPQEVPTEVQQSTPRVVAPDYSEEISRLLEQSSTQGRRGSFDAQLRAKHEREAGRAGLAQVAGLQQAGEQAALGQNKLIADQQNALQQRAAETAAGMRRQAVEDRGYALDVDKFLAQQAGGAGQAEQQQFERDLAARRLALEEGRQTDVNTATARKAATEQGANQARANAFIAKLGGSIDPNTGEVRTGRGTIFGTDVDPEATALYNAILKGVAPPVDYLFPKQ